jgi:predicted phage terminase large subunit-like protein
MTTLPPSQSEALLRRHLATFVQKSFKAINPGATYLPNWHIEAITHRLEQCHRREIRRLAIAVPPRSLKSICASVAFPAWLLGQDPTLEITCASYNRELANDLALKTRTVMESTWYRRLFPETRFHPRKNTDTEMKTDRMGCRYATSVGGTLTGRGGNFIIIDDPIKPGEVMSAAERATVNQWFESTVYSRLNVPNDDVIILVIQRVHVDDLIGHVLEKENWEYLEIPAIAGEQRVYDLGRGGSYMREAGEVLDEARLNRAALDNIKANIGTYNFEAQYQQRPVPPGGALIKWAWFQTYDQAPDVSVFDVVVQSWDTASALTQSSNYSVCTTWGVKGCDYYLLDVVRERLEFPALKRRVVHEQQKYEADYVLIEDTSSGTALCQDLRQSGALRSLRWRPKIDKITRMEQQTPKIEAGRVFLPKEAPWLHEFRVEVMAFPNSKHDDQVDSLSQFLSWIGNKEWRRGGPVGRERSRPQGHVRPAGAPLTSRSTWYTRNPNSGRTTWW